MKSRLNILSEQFKKSYKATFSTTFNSVTLSAKTLIKWIICSVVIGSCVGAVGAVFHHILDYVTHTRDNHPYILFLLPLAGVIIVFLYNHIGDNSKKGTNLVISAIQSGERVPLRMTPLIIISTALTHLFGGSAGREGAALQIGGSMGNFFAKLVKYNPADTKIAIMCGMSACFSALFGTPVAAAVFSMEVINVGIMQYAALVPCVIAALIAYIIAGLTGLKGTRFTVGTIPSFDIFSAGKMIILAIAFACASILLCTVLHKASHIMEKLIKNAYLRIIIAAVLIIALRFLIGTTDYLGAGTSIIENSFTSNCDWYVFLLKILFTAITLGGGFKGGEIVPTLFVGATLGSFLAPVFGLPIGLCAACGMVGVFCGVTNSPLTSLILAIEMFGSESILFVSLCIAISYLLSGHFSLYSTQKIAYSKYRQDYVDINSM